MQSDKSVREKLLHGFQAVMLDDAQKQLAISRSAVSAGDELFRKTQGLDPAKEDDDMIHIGDVTVNQAASDSPAASPGATTTAAGKTGGKLLQAALGAGLLATGAGGAIGGPMLVNALMSMGKPVIEQQIQEWDAKVEMRLRPNSGQVAPAPPD